jgi:hypothetical protein
MKTIRKKRLLHRLTKKNVLGKGQVGIVYNAVNEDGTHYALKESKLGRHEIEFAETISKKYPHQFMTLYNHSDNTAVWSKIDQTFRKFLKTSNSPMSTILDVYIQIFNIINILQKEGWMHGDFHIGNIGLVKTEEPTIIIQGHHIPTHGYLVQAIDYGTVKHMKNPSYDIYRLFAQVYDTDEKHHWGLHSLKKPTLTPTQLTKIKSHLPKGDGFIQTNLSIILFGILFPTEFKKQYPNIQLLHYLDDSTILYLIKNMKKIDVCLNYLINIRKKYNK